MTAELVNDWYYRGPHAPTALDRLRSASLIACDTESVSLNDLTCIGIGVYWSDTEGAYFPVFPMQSEFLALVMSKLADPTVTKIWHNYLGFDSEVLELLTEEGFEQADDTNIEDTSIAAQVSGLPAALQRLGEEYLGADDLFSIQSLFESYGCRDMLGVPPYATAEKCLNDCRTTWQLYQSLDGSSGNAKHAIATLSPAQRDCYQIDRRLIHVLRNMQRKGLGLRQDVLAEYQQRLEQSISELEHRLMADGLDSPASFVQCANVLARRGNMLPFTDRTRQRLSTKEEVLEELDDPVARTLLEWRKATKLLSTYILPWVGRDRAYTHFRLDLATGRLASGAVNKWDHVNRNLQNIPPDLREVFSADSGTWTWADHGQLELRIIAHMSGDPVMMDAYATGKDLHALTAVAAEVTRDMGKTANFADAFGGGEKKLAKVLGVTVEKARQVKAAKDSLYSGAEAWKQRLMWQPENDYAETLFGRRCRLPQQSDQPQWAMWSARKWAAHVGSCNVNFRVQGTGADILKRGLLLLHDQGYDERVSVHDEHVCSGGPVEMPEELAHLHPDLWTPFETKHGEVWS